MGIQAKPFLERHSRLTVWIILKTREYVLYLPLNSQGLAFSPVSTQLGCIVRLLRK